MAGNSKGGRSGGQILIDALVQHEVERVFGVPGESYLAALDGFYNARNKIEFTICRQEETSSNSAATNSARQWLVLNSSATR